MTNEAKFQLLPDSTGKAVRLLEGTTVINGVSTTVEIQVVAICDSQGTIIEDFGQISLRAILAELTCIRKIVTDRFNSERAPEVNE